MTTVNCPVEGWGDFVIEYPDELKVKHQQLYLAGVQKALEEHEGITVQMVRFYGARALCSRFEGAPDAPVEEWPLAAFSWFMNTVYYGHYDKAVSPPKNSLPAAPTTPKA
jgi:hypothetical protein